MVYRIIVEKITQNGYNFHELNIPILKLCTLHMHILYLSNLLYISESSVNIHTLKWPSLLAANNVGFQIFLHCRNRELWCVVLMWHVNLCIKNKPSRKETNYFYTRVQYDLLSLSTKNSLQVVHFPIESLRLGNLYITTRMTNNWVLCH